jgi:5-aminopentanamidase
VKLSVYREKSTAGDVPGALELLRRRALAAAEPGASLAIFPEMFLTGYNIGILICYDVEFPEAVRALALAGAELIAVPTALIRPFDIVARTLVPARAFENQVYVAYAGMCGSEAGLGYCGLSCIVGPDGQDLARAGTGADLLLADIDLSAISRSRKENPYFIDRNPELYAAPVKPVSSFSGK